MSSRHWPVSLLRSRSSVTRLNTFASAIREPGSSSGSARFAAPLSFTPKTVGTSRSALPWVRLPIPAFRPRAFPFTTAADTRGFSCRPVRGRSTRTPTDACASRPTPDILIELPGVLHRVTHDDFGFRRDASPGKTTVRASVLAIVVRLRADVPVHPSIQVLLDDHLDALLLLVAQACTSISSVIVLREVSTRKSICRRSPTTSKAEPSLSKHLFVARRVVDRVLADEFERLVGRIELRHADATGRQRHSHAVRFGVPESADRRRPCGCDCTP